MVVYAFWFKFQVGPIGLLYVGQREMAAVATHDKNVNIIGSDDATTCIIVVVRHSGNTFYFFSIIQCKINYKIVQHIDLKRDRFRNI